MRPLFSSLPLSKAMLQVVGELGYETLTPIQAQAIPHLLAGKDLIGQSKTGSGKTAAFSIPILERIKRQQRQIQTLILCPTRELCTQVAREIRKLGRHHPGLNVLILSGGLPIYPQVKALEGGAHIAVGTPGRVLDHLERGTLDLRRVFAFVLDEADRMLDMGFEVDMEKIVGELPIDRQTILFSATFPRTIEAISHKFQKNPERVTIEDVDTTKIDIQQELYTVESPDRMDALKKLLTDLQPESAIVFCNLKATVAEVADQLSYAGISAAAIHGDLDQADRDRVMAKFRNQSTRVLVATDVAARGLDVENLEIVFNFDLSPDPEIYVHRIGRTGRAGKKGLAISLAGRKETAKIDRIEKYTGVELQKKELSGQQPSVAAERPAVTQTAKMETLFIGGGRKDKVRPGDILGALTGEAGGLNGADIGKIEIHDRFSYVAVSKSVAAVALERLTHGRIKGRKFRIEKVR